MFLRTMQSKAVAGLLMSSSSFMPGQTFLNLQKQVFCRTTKQFSKDAFLILMTLRAYFVTFTRHGTLYLKDSKVL